MLKTQSPPEEPIIVRMYSFFVILYQNYGNDVHILAYVFTGTLNWEMPRGKEKIFIT